MARLSRPYQIAIVAVLVLFLAWFVLLRSHGSTPGAGASASSGNAALSSPAGSTHSAGSSGGSHGAAASAAEQAREAAKPSKVYNGSAPGLHGLSKDVRKAHEAVGLSQQQAAAAEASPVGSGSTQQSSAISSGASAAAGSGATHATAGNTARHAATRHAATKHGAPVRHAAAVNAKTGTPSSATKHAGGAENSARSANGGHAAAGAAHRSPAVVVASQLSAGKVVLLLFWNPLSSDDAAVHSQVQAVAHAMKGKVAVDFAKAGEVGSFGTVTRDVSVYQTPTLLVIGKKGLVSTISGLTDAFAIEQAIREAEH